MQINSIYYRNLGFKAKEKTEVAKLSFFLSLITGSDSSVEVKKTYHPINVCIHSVCMCVCVITYDIHFFHLFFICFWWKIIVFFLLLFFFVIVCLYVDVIVFEYAPIHTPHRPILSANRTELFLFFRSPQQIECNLISLYILTNVRQWLTLKMKQSRLITTVTTTKKHEKKFNE